MKYDPSEVADLVCGVCRVPHCFWCGRRVKFGRAGDRLAATREHMIPVAMGGSNANWNKELACRSCNEARGTALDWVPFHTHEGDPTKMNPAQAVLVGAVKVGATGLSVDDLPEPAPGDFAHGYKENKSLPRPRKKPCSECGAEVTGVYPGKRCYSCWTRRGAKAGKSTRGRGEPNE